MRNWENRGISGDKFVGRTMLPEIKPSPESEKPNVTIPEYRQIGEVFGGKYIFEGGGLFG